jgi:hypothetical protein
MSEVEDGSPARSLNDSPGEGADESSAVHLLWRFSAAVDARLAGAVSRLFATDGIFRRGSELICGRDDIEKFYTSRLGDSRRVTRHLWSNVECQLLEPPQARLNAALTTYAFEPEISESHLQLRIGNVLCRCLREADGRWVFAEHTYERAFVAYLPLSPAFTATPGASLP